VGVHRPLCTQPNDAQPYLLRHHTLPLCCLHRRGSGQAVAAAQVTW
jgi:hypothetical protein